jgi:hypothetical protein
MWIDLSLSQRLKAHLLITETLQLPSNVTLDSDPQKAKQRSSMCPTEQGMQIALREDAANTDSLSDRTLELASNLTAGRDAHDSKHSGAMRSTEFGITISVSLAE